MAVYEEEVGFVFDMPISLGWQLEILQSSTSAPHYVEVERKGANFEPVRYAPPRTAYRWDPPDEEAEVAA